MDGRLFGQVRSNTPKQHENQKNNQDDTDKTNPAMSITVTVTAEAATETAKQKNDEDDDEIVPTTWRNSFALRQPKARCRGKSVRYCSHPGMWIALPAAPSAHGKIRKVYLICG